MSCKCQGCGRPYKLDVMVSDDMWERIKPVRKAIGAGLLCGCCICAKIEAKIGYGACCGKAEADGSAEAFAILGSDALNLGPKQIARLAAEWTPDD